MWSSNMEFLRRSFLRLVAAAAAVPLLAAIAGAQDFPSRPITLVVPLPAGGAFDALARLLADHMRTTLGQPVIVENIPGADRGILKVVHADPDGYTLGVGGWAPYVLRPLVFSLPFDLQKDMEPVAFVGDAPFWIIANKNFPAENLTEFIAWLKANPGKASAGTTGAGGGSHLCGLHLQNTIGTSFQFIPYRGGAPALQDLVAGQIDFYCDLAANSLAQVRAGTVKAFAMMSRTRWPAAPEVPTGDETGLPGLYISNWTGIWAPAGTPKPIIDKINAAIGAALADPQVSKRYADLGQELPAPGQHTAETLRKFHKAEVEKWGPIIKAAHIQPN
jgi:tripartite-type tricarboxylate transporter receptor subunit TctC